MTQTITPAWMGLEDASKWSGLSTRVLQHLIKDRHITSSNCRLPGNTRGRRLIDTSSLDAYIRAGVDAPPAEIAVNKGRSKTPKKP